MSDITPPTLIVDPNRGFRTWIMTEIYRPGSNGSIVPNVNDAVWDWTNGLYRVTAVDYTTGISTLQKYNPPADAGGLSDQDILLGAGPGYQSESFRVYINTSVIPHSMAIDSRLHFYGTTVSNVKVFLGTNTSATGQVISAFYDQSGNLLGDAIPLEVVAMNDVTNIAIKTPKVGYTNHQFPDGEVVTIVAYDDAGHAVSIAKCLVKNTAFIRSADASMKYIASISIETPFLSSSDPKVIEYPINMPVQNLNLMGVVTYSDGSTSKMPIDGTKFRLYGLENYIATIQGQTVPLVLAYQVGPSEYSYITPTTANGMITESYSATTSQADGTYSVKLFVYPVWINAINGYRLEYFLYNLDRDVFYPVTNLVQLATNSQAFNPTLYGTVQNIQAAINLNEVYPGWANYRHVQTFSITLSAPGDTTGQDNWLIAYSPGQSPQYGVGTQAIADFVNTNNWRIDVSCGCATKEEWLEKVYYAAQPLVDLSTETQAPEPNYFVLVVGNQQVEVPVDGWNTPITTNNAPAEGGLVYLRWLRRGAATDLQLGISGLIVHRQ